jgi:hypothetical protein
MDAWPRTAWVTRANQVDMHDPQSRFSGWSIGLDGVTGFRLYDKTLGPLRSRKDYLLPL